MLGLLEQVGVQLEGRRDRGVGRGVGAHPLRREMAEALGRQAVLVGHAEKLGDDVHREQHREVLDHVELIAVAEVVEEVHARRTDAGLEVGDHAGVNRRLITLRCHVCRGGSIRIISF